MGCAPVVILVTSQAGIRPVANGLLLHGPVRGEQGGKQQAGMGGYYAAAMYRTVPHNAAQCLNDHTLCVLHMMALVLHKGIYWDESAPDRAWRGARFGDEG